MRIVHRRVTGISRSFLALACTASLGIGCTAVPTRDDGTDASGGAGTARTVELDADRLGTSTDAIPVVVDAAVFGVSRAVAGPRYAAASGHDCRHVLDEQGRSLGRTVCERAGGVWSLGRALGGSPDGIWLGSHGGTPADSLLDPTR